METTFPSLERDRVRRNTRAEALARIDERTAQNIRFYSTQPGPVIDRRIEDLEREWSIECWLETNASALAFTSLVHGITTSRKWLLLTGTALGFLFQHAVQGWCPPLPVLRQLGIRTRGEIDREKYTLIALRGDFDCAETEGLGESPTGASLAGTVPV